MSDDLLKQLDFCASLHPQLGYPKNGEIFAAAAAEIRRVQAELARVTARLDAVVIARDTMGHLWATESAARIAAETKLAEREAQVERLIEAQADQDQQLKDTEAALDSYRAATDAAEAAAQAAHEARIRAAIREDGE